MAGGRRAAGELPRARSHRGGGAVGAAHAGHTFGFDDTVAWLAVACSKTAVCELMRIAWRTVGAIVARVWADADKTVDRFANLRRIGIDEISYKRHHKYLTVVVDHDSGRLIWAAPGRDTTTLRRFFDALGAERCNRSPTCPLMPRTGSPTSSPSAARARSGVPTRFMWSRGLPRRRDTVVRRRAWNHARALAWPRARPQAQGRPVCAVESQQQQLPSRVHGHDPSQTRTRPEPSRLLHHRTRPRRAIPD